MKHKVAVIGAGNVGASAALYIAERGLADVVLITHATPGGKSESFCHELSAEGKPVFALDTMENTNLFTLGAEPLRPRQIKDKQALLRVFDNPPLWEE